VWLQEYVEVQLVMPGRLLKVPPWLQQQIFVQQEHSMALLQDKEILFLRLLGHVLDKMVVLRHQHVASRNVLLLLDSDIVLP
jgi:hypothetical protein